jgi:hypothetical protein
MYKLRESSSFLIGTVVIDQVAPFTGHRAGEQMALHLRIFPLNARHAQEAGCI